MSWSYRVRADDQLYADDEHGPTVFDPGAPISAGTGNVVSVGIPLVNQLAIWTDPTHIAGATVIPAAAHPAHTGDVTSPAGSVALTYANPVPMAKAGLPIGGSAGQVLVKNSVANYDTSWATGGGNVSNVATPAAGQLALWTDATHVQGVAVLPAANFPALTGDVVVGAGTFITSYNMPVPTAKAGLPIGGSSGQILQKNTGTNYDTSWVNAPVSGGNVSNSGAPQGGQVAIWADGTHIQGQTVLPLVNLPTVPTTKAGLPTGGATNYVLMKISNVDYDAGWFPAPTGGGGGGDLNFIHSQVAPAASWAITHNLGKFPSVSVVDSGQSLIIPDVLYVDNNRVTLSFGASTSGKAYLN
jgi:hypothetical protein